MTDINMDNKVERQIEHHRSVFMKYYYHVEILVAYWRGVSGWLELNVKYERWTFYGR